MMDGLNFMYNDKTRVCVITLEIPQGGTKHSLNISVCVGIVAWEMAKQLENLN